MTINTLHSTTVMTNSIRMESVGSVVLLRLFTLLLVLPLFWGRFWGLGGGVSSAPEMAPRSFGTATAAPPFCARSLSRALYTVCRPFVFWVLFLVPSVYSECYGNAE